MKQVGLTGNIGSGKTTVCRLFEMMGVPVYYADARAREITRTEEVLDRIRQNFGGEVFDEKGLLNRKKLGDIVFNDKQSLAVLNGIIHPRVERDYRLWLDEKADHPYCIKEAAILFETGSYRSFDKIIVVVASAHTRLGRIMARDGLDEEQVRQRMKNQMDQKLLEQRADHIIINDNGHAVLPQVLELHNMLQGQGA